MWGADTDQLEQLGQQIGVGADALRTTRTALNHALFSAPWGGPDAEQFRGAWTSTYAVHLEAAAQHLTDAYEVLRRNAQGQRDASDSNGAGPGGTGPIGPGITGPAADDGPPFADTVEGQDPQAVDEDLAELAQSVYNFPDGAPDGWEALTADELIELGIDPADLDRGGLLNLQGGFKAGVYRDDDGNLVLAFAGTDMTSATDWATNAEQALGIDTKQYNQALEVATKLKAAVGDDLVITGHSLGGGLASYAALGTDTPAVTFNAAGLSDGSFENLGMDPAEGRQIASDGLVRRYSVESDILTNLQENTPAPEAVGHHIELNDPTEADTWGVGPFQVDNPFDVHSANMHGSGAVVDAIEKDKPWEN